MKTHTAPARGAKRNAFIADQIRVAAQGAEQRARGRRGGESAGAEMTGRNQQQQDPGERHTDAVDEQQEPFADARRLGLGPEFEERPSEHAEMHGRERECVDGAGPEQGPHIDSPNTRAALRPRIAAWSAAPSARRSTCAASASMKGSSVPKSSCETPTLSIAIRSTGAANAQVS